MVKLPRILIALAMVAAITTAVVSDQAPHPEPGGASVVAATPRASAAPEPEIPAPQTPPEETQPGTESTEPPPPQLSEIQLGTESPPPAPDGSETPPATTGINDCIEATSANLGLATAPDRDTARAAADTLEKYDPPANVRTAIEYFVGTRGAMFSDPNFATRNKLISDWIKQLCPNP